MKATENESANADRKDVWSDYGGRGEAVYCEVGARYGVALPQANGSRDGFDGWSRAGGYRFVDGGGG